MLTYVFSDILKTSTKNGKEIVTHIAHVMYEGRWDHLQFHTFRRKFVYCWHLTMQGMKTKLSNYRRRSQQLYSINCAQEGHVYKTNIGTFIHSYYTLPWWYVFLSIQFSYGIFFLHRLNGHTFWVYRQYSWYLKILRYGSLAVALSTLYGVIRSWWQAKAARKIFLTMSLIWHSINK